MTSIDWAQIRHAYGQAGNIPRLLADARTSSVSDDYTDEPWYSLWSSLFHQNDIYAASYAAVPDLVALAAARIDATGIESLYLVASIELRRNEAGAPPMPREIEQDYRDALQSARPLAVKLRSAGSRPDDVIRVQIAEAVLAGNYSLARRLFDEDDPAD